MPNEGIPGDGTLDFPAHDNSNEGGPMANGMSTSCTSIVLEQDMEAHSALMLETRGNAQSASSVVRHAGAMKFAKEDPIEAAAVEMILQLNK